MIHDRDVLNIRSLAVFLTAGPLALLLCFAALDMSWAKFSHSPTKANLANELSPTQPASLNNQ